MTFKDYCQEFKSTLNTKLDVKDSIIDYTLGLVGESGEVYNTCVDIKLGDNVNIVTGRIEDEVGDLIWYTSALYRILYYKDMCDTVNLSYIDDLSKLEPRVICRFDHEKTFKAVTTEIMQITAGIAENVKHYAYHNRDLDLSLIEDALIEIVYLVGNVLLIANTNFPHGNRIFFEDVFARNIAKLKKRHPNGFSE